MKSLRLYFHTQLLEVVDGVRTNSLVNRDRHGRDQRVDGFDARLTRPTCGAVSGRDEFDSVEREFLVRLNHW